MGANAPIEYPDGKDLKMNTTSMRPQGTVALGDVLTDEVVGSIPTRASGISVLTIYKKYQLFRTMSRYNAYAIFCVEKALRIQSVNPDVYRLYLKIKAAAGGVNIKEDSGNVEMELQLEIFRSCGVFYPAADLPNVYARYRFYLQHDATEICTKYERIINAHLVDPTDGENEDESPPEDTDDDSDVDPFARIAPDDTVPIPKKNSFESTFVARMVEDIITHWIKITDVYKLIPKNVTRIVNSLLFLYSETEDQWTSLFRDKITNLLENKCRLWGVEMTKHLVDTIDESCNNTDDFTNALAEYAGKYNLPPDTFSYEPVSEDASWVVVNESALRASDHTYDYLFTQDSDPIATGKDDAPLRAADVKPWFTKFRRVVKRINAVKSVESVVDYLAKLHRPQILSSSLSRDPQFESPETSTHKKTEGLFQTRFCAVRDEFVLLSKELGVFRRTGSFYDHIFHEFTISHRSINTPNLTFHKTWVGVDSTNINAIGSDKFKGRLCDDGNVIQRAPRPMVIDHKEYTFTLEYGSTTGRKLMALREEFYGESAYAASLKTGRHPQLLKGHKVGQIHRVGTTETDELLETIQTKLAEKAKLLFSSADALEFIPCANDRLRHVIMNENDSVGGMLARDLLHNLLSEMYPDQNFSTTAEYNMWIMCAFLHANIERWVDTKTNAMVIYPIVDARITWVDFIEKEKSNLWVVSFIRFARYYCETSAFTPTVNTAMNLSEYTSNGKWPMNPVRDVEKWARILRNGRKAAGPGT